MDNTNGIHHDNIGSNNYIDTNTGPTDVISINNDNTGCSPEGKSGNKREMYSLNINNMLKYMLTTITTFLF